MERHAEPAAGASLTLGSGESAALRKAAAPLTLPERAHLDLRLRSAPWRRVVEAFEPDGRLVDFGCGPGLLAHLLLRAGFAGTYLGLDPDSRKVDRARRWLPESPARLFRAGTVDAVTPGAFSQAALIDVLYLVPPSERPDFLARAARSDTRRTLRRAHERGRAALEEAAGYGAGTACRRPRHHPGRGRGHLRRCGGRPAARGRRSPGGRRRRRGPRLSPRFRARFGAPPAHLTARPFFEIVRPETPGRDPLGGRTEDAFEGAPAVDDSAPRSRGGRVGARAACASPPPSLRLGALGPAGPRARPRRRAARAARPARRSCPSGVPREAWLARGIPVVPWPRRSRGRRPASRRPRRRCGPAGAGRAPGRRVARGAARARRRGRGLATRRAGRAGRRRGSVAPFDRERPRSRPAARCHGGRSLRAPRGGHARAPRGSRRRARAAGRRGARRIARSARSRASGGFPPASRVLPARCRGWTRRALARPRSRAPGRAARVPGVRIALGPRGRGRAPAARPRSRRGSAGRFRRGARERCASSALRRRASHRARRDLPRKVGRAFAPRVRGRASRPRLPALRHASREPPALGGGAARRLPDEPRRRGIASLAALRVRARRRGRVARGGRRGRGDGCGPLPRRRARTRGAVRSRGGAPRPRAGAAGRFAPSGSRARGGRSPVERFRGRGSRRGRGRLSP